MGLGEGQLGQLGYGQDFPVPQIGCNPLLRDQYNRFWSLGVQNDGAPSITLTSIPMNHQQNPNILVGSDIWQLSVDASSLGDEAIQVTKLNSLFLGGLGEGGLGEQGYGTGVLVRPPNPVRTLTYIPLISPIGGAWALTVSSDGDVLLTATDYLFPDVIPYPPDVTMSTYGAMPFLPLLCATCGNASVTASADLSLWCCTCSSFVPPEDTNILVVIDE